jgi:hypothetical protein
MVPLLAVVAEATLDPEDSEADVTEHEERNDSVRQMYVAKQEQEKEAEQRPEEEAMPLDEVEGEVQKDDANDEGSHGWTS